MDDSQWLSSKTPAVLITISRYLKYSIMAENVAEIDHM